MTQWQCLIVRNLGPWAKPRPLREKKDHKVAAAGCHMPGTPYKP